MDGQTDYYTLLGLARNAPAAEIKNAYRKLALTHHPDMNADSAEAHARFILIGNAYSTLGDPARRTAYDRFITGSTQRRAASSVQSASPVQADKTAQANAPRAASSEQAAPERRTAPDKGATHEKNTIVRSKPQGAANHDYFENHLNYILWDLGDLLMKDHDWRGNKSYDGNAFRKEALTVLTFIDKWVLECAGLADYFLDARKLGHVDPRNYINTIGAKDAPGTHAPFTSTQNYYYNIRMRMNKYLEKIDAIDLFATIVTNRPDGTSAQSSQSGAPGIRVIDALVETQKLSFHYIAYLKAIIDGTHTGPIPAFTHSSSLFNWPE